MVTVERVPHDHLQAAQRRLNNAFDIYRRASNRRYEDAFLEFADVAMLVWSAGVDVASALMRLDDQSDLGTSSRRWRYVTRVLHTTYPQRELRTGWRHLARLHNFQHNLNMPQSQFEPACRGSGQLINELNGLVPDDLRLPPESYGWLVRVS